MSPADECTRACEEGRPFFVALRRVNPFFAVLRRVNLIFCPITYQVIRISGYQAVDIRIAEYQEAAVYLIFEPLVFCTLFS